MNRSASFGSRSSVVLPVLGAAALLAPSSHGGVILPGLNVIYAAAIALSLLAFVGRLRVNLLDWVLVIVLAAIAATGTITTAFPYIAWGAIGPYVLLFALFVVDAGASLATPISLKIFFVVSGCLLCLGYGTVLEVPVVMNLVENSYKAISEDLFESMIIWGSKPVGVFASHSIAAFAYFGLAITHYLILWSGMVRSIRVISGVCAVGFVGLLPLLMSNSGFFLFLGSVCLLLGDLLRRGGGKWFLMAVPVAMLVLLLSPLGGAALELVDDAGDVVAGVLEYEEGGLLGRYASGGRLQPTYDYLLAHPMQPIGLAYSEAIALGDNFVGEYVVRFGLGGYLLVLVLLARFLLRWAVSAALAVGLFLYFFAADLGYPLLPYVRVAGALPWIITVLNVALSRERCGVSDASLRAECGESEFGVRQVRR